MDKLPYKIYYELVNECFFICYDTDNLYKRAIAKCGYKHIGLIYLN